MYIYLYKLITKWVYCPQKRRKSPNGKLPNREGLIQQSSFQCIEEVAQQERPIESEKGLGEKQSDGILCGVRVWGSGQSDDILCGSGGLGVGGAHSTESRLLYGDLIDGFPMGRVSSNRWKYGKEMEG